MITISSQGKEGGGKILINAVVKKHFELQNKLLAE
jgi:hypothetical protein